LLHADLHHHNILAAERHPWLAIDPKGVIGDAAYERAPLGWELVQSVLSAWWSFEDHGHGYEAALHIAELISRLH
jgi:streptomycin 6-kinase